MAAASAQYDSLDGRLAHKTRLALTGIDSMLQLEKSLFAIGIDIIGNRRAAQRDRLSQNLLDGHMQFSKLFASERRSTAARPNPRAKQRLVGVDIADPAYQFLIQQRALDRRLTGVEEIA